MDAVTHKETGAQLAAMRLGRSTALGRAGAAAPGGPAGGIVAEVKRLAMDAVRNVETVAQIGAVKLTGGVALYAAHIRQMDTAHQRQRQQTRQTTTPHVERL